MKPIYERKIWNVLHDAAKHLRLALEHTLSSGVKGHINDATKILDSYFVEDSKKERKKNAN